MNILSWQGKRKTDIHKDSTSWKPNSKKILTWVFLFVEILNKICTTNQLAMKGIGTLEHKGKQINYILAEDNGK